MWSKKKTSLHTDSPKETVDPAAVSSWLNVARFGPVWRSNHPLFEPFPHAQVTKMAFAWSKDQTPSNYYYYYYYYYHQCCVLRDTSFILAKWGYLLACKKQLVDTIPPAAWRPGSLAGGGPRLTDRAA